MNHFKIALSATIIFFTFSLVAQNPVPAPAQQKPVCIVGATAHLGNGRVIENCLIAFDKGKITRVDTNNGAENLEAYEVIEATGKHVYPGFIAANTDLGLVEIGAVRSTRDSREVGDMNANVRSIIAYNTDSEIIPTVRNHGVLTAQVCPEGGLISGSSSVVHLDAWNWEDAALKTDDGIHLNWPRPFSFNFRAGTVKKDEKYGEQLSAMESLFSEAKAYAQKTAHDPQNLKLEAMRGLFNKSQPLFIHTDDAQSISLAVLFAKKYGLSAVIVGGYEAWRVTDLLKENNVPVILDLPQSLPQRADDNIDQPFKNPAMLEKAGVLFCLSIGGDWQVRNLGYQAGQSVAFGLDYEKALQSITLNVARILGVENRLGSIEVRKDATLFISSGDALDMRTSEVEKAFIQGRQINLEDKQKYLYRKFSEKYERSE